MQIFKNYYLFYFIFCDLISLYVIDVFFFFEIEILFILLSKIYVVLKQNKEIDKIENIRVIEFFKLQGSETYWKRL